MPAGSSLRAAASGVLDVAAELPQVDVDTRRWREGDRLAFDAQRRAVVPAHPPRLEDRTHPGQRHTQVASRGQGVEVRPHQIGEAIAAQRPGKDEQLEQGTHPTATKVGYCDHLVADGDLQLAEHADLHGRTRWVGKRVEQRRRPRPQRLVPMGRGVVELGANCGRGEVGESDCQAPATDVAGGDCSTGELDRPRQRECREHQVSISEVLRPAELARTGGQ